MLMNNLDPEVAENPDALVVYGGTGRAARSWEAFDAIVRALRALADDETLLVQSGKPVGVFRTHPWAPRVLIANSNLVGKWATWEHFRELERAGLMMYGQMTAGSWIYIGTQGILQGTYETFAELARRHFGGSLRGTVILTAGLGGMGGAQPLAVTMNDGVADGDRGRRGAGPPATRDRLPRRDAPMPSTPPSRWRAWPPAGARPFRSASSETPPRSPEWSSEGERSTSSPTRPPPTTRCNGYVPHGDDARGGAGPAARDSRTTTSGARSRRWPLTCGRCSPSRSAARSSSTTATTSGHRRRRPASRTRSTSRASCPLYIRPLFCEGRGPFRWVALSGDPEDIYRTDRAILQLFPEDDGLRRWIQMAREKVPFQGLPARICWLGYGERAKVRGWRSTSWSGAAR